MKGDIRPSPELDMEKILREADHAEPSVPLENEPG